MPIEDSIVVEHMAEAPPAWIWTQRLGTWVLFASYAMSAVVILGEVFFTYLESIPRPVFMAVRILPLVLLALAVWLLTTQRADRRVKKANLLVRWGFVGVLALSILIPVAKQEGLKSIWAKLVIATFFTLLVICWIGLGCIQIRVARMLGARRLAPLIWTASILWSVGLLLTATFYVFREFTGRYLFMRSETSFVALLLIGGVLLVISSLMVVLAFIRKPKAA